MSKPGYMVINIRTCIPLSFNELGVAVPANVKYADGSCIAIFPTKRQALEAGKVYLSKNSSIADPYYPLVIGKEYSAKTLERALQ